MARTAVKSFRATPEVWAEVEAKAQASGAANLNAYVIEAARGGGDNPPPLAAKPDPVRAVRKVVAAAPPATSIGRRILGYSALDNSPIYARAAKPKEGKKGKS